MSRPRLLLQLFVAAVCVQTALPLPEAAGSDQPLVLLLFQANASRNCVGQCQLHAGLQPCAAPGAAAAGGASPGLTDSTAALEQGWNTLALDAATADAVAAELSVTCDDAACKPSPARLAAWRGSACPPTSEPEEQEQQLQQHPDLVLLSHGLGDDGSADRAFSLGNGSVSLITVAQAARQEVLGPPAAGEQPADQEPAAGVGLGLAEHWQQECAAEAPSEAATEEGADGQEFPVQEDEGGQVPAGDEEQEGGAEDAAEPVLSDSQPDEAPQRLLADAAAAAAAATCHTCATKGSAQRLAQKAGLLAWVLAWGLLGPGLLKARLTAKAAA